MNDIFFPMVTLEKVAELSLRSLSESFRGTLDNSVWSLMVRAIKIYINKTIKIHGSTYFFTIQNINQYFFIS